MAKIVRATEFAKERTDSLTNFENRYFRKHSNRKGTGYSSREMSNYDLLKAARGSKNLTLTREHFAGANLHFTFLHLSSLTMSPSSMVLSAVVALSLLIQTSAAALHRATSTVIGQQGQSLVFDDQLSLHKSRGAKKISKASAVLTMDEFMKSHLPSLGVKEESIELLHELKLSATRATVLHYDQMVNGIKVFASRVTITTGSHGGVIKATGRSAQPPQESRREEDQ